MACQSHGFNLPIVQKIVDLGSVAKKLRKAEGRRTPADFQLANTWSVGAVDLAIWLVISPTMIAGRDT